MNLPGAGAKSGSRVTTRRVKPLHTTQPALFASPAHIELRDATPFVTIGGAAASGLRAIPCCTTRPGPMVIVYTRLHRAAPLCRATRRQCRTRQSHCLARNYRGREPSGKSDAVPRRRTAPRCKASRGHERDPPTTAPVGSSLVMRSRRNGPPGTDYCSTESPSSKSCQSARERSGSGTVTTGTV